MTYYQLNKITFQRYIDSLSDHKLIQQLKDKFSKFDHNIKLTVQKLGYLSTKTARQMSFVTDHDKEINQLLRYLQTNSEYSKVIESFPNYIQLLEVYLKLKLNQKIIDKTKLKDFFKKLLKDFNNNNGIYLTFVNSSKKHDRLPYELSSKIVSSDKRQIENIYTQLNYIQQKAFLRFVRLILNIEIRTIHNFITKFGITGINTDSNSSSVSMRNLSVPSHPIELFDPTVSTDHQALTGFFDLSVHVKDSKLKPPLGQSRQKSIVIDVDPIQTKINQYLIDLERETPYIQVKKSFPNYIFLLRKYLKNKKKKNLIKRADKKEFNTLLNTFNCILDIKLDYLDHPKEVELPYKFKKKKLLTSKDIESFYKKLNYIQQKAFLKFCYNIDKLTLNTILNFKRKFGIMFDRDQPVSTDIFDSSVGIDQHASTDIFDYSVGIDDDDYQASTGLLNLKFPIDPADHTDTGFFDLTDPADHTDHIDTGFIDLTDPADHTDTGFIDLTDQDYQALQRFYDSLIENDQTDFFDLSDPSNPQASTRLLGSSVFMSRDETNHPSVPIKDPNWIVGSNHQFQY